jgi:glycosyltransferase involved in cell wall biosynthesis
MCDVSVVIPTYNRAQLLDRALSALENQNTVAVFQVIVVDDGSDDDTPVVAARQRRYPVRYIKQHNQGPGPARNAGIKTASAPIILFIDDDVVPAPDLVDQHARSQSTSPCVVIGRLEMPTTRQPAWAEWECRTLESQYSNMVAGVFAPTPRQFYTANVSVPRSALIASGLFNPQYRRAEDVELAYRLNDRGLVFTFNNDAVVTHDTPRSFGAWKTIATQYGECDIRMWRAGRDHILLNIAEELDYARNAITRSLVRLATGRPLVIDVLAKSGALAINTLSRTGPRRLALAACGAYFNMLYMDSACRELGLGRESFWKALAVQLHEAERNPAPAAPR